MDQRGGQADAAQMPVDAGKVRHILRKPRRRVHQDAAFPAQRQAFITPGRGIAGQWLPFSRAPARLRQHIVTGKTAQRRDHGGPPSGNLRQPPFTLWRQPDPYCVRRRIRPQAVGPFNQTDCRLERLLQPQFAGLIGMGQPVKIGVPDVGRAFIGLDQSIGRRGHILLAPQPRADQGTAEMGLARPDRPLQQDRVTSLQHGRQRAGQPVRIRVTRKENTQGLPGHAPF